MLIKISGNAVRLNYTHAELNLLKIINPPYLCFGQSEAKIDLEKCNWNGNVTDSQRRTAKIKLEKFREIASSTEDIKLDVYDDKDNVIGTFQLQCNDTEKS